MVQIILDGHSYGNEIADVVRLFCFKDEIEIAECDPRENYGGILLYTKVYISDTEYSVNCSLRAQAFSKSLDRDLSFPGEEPALKIKKEIKWELKRQVYLLFEEYTGASQPWGMLTGIRPSKIVHEMLDSGADHRQIVDFLTDYCRVSQKKASLALDVAQNEGPVLKGTASDMVSLYIGIPFCPSRCLYCSFISDTIGRCGQLVNKYLEALKRELEGVSLLLEKNSLKLQSVYIGGGTPTSITAVQLAGLLEYIDNVFSLGELQEYTLEAGRPDSLDEEKLHVISNSRVDRISINPQTMNNDTLRLIGRNHTAEDIVKAFWMARKAGFNHINMDVIAGLPGETLTDFEKTMKAIRQLNPESLTVHALSVKRASRLNEEKAGFNKTSSNEAKQMVDMGMQYSEKMCMWPYYLYRQKNILGNLENIGYCKPGYESIYNIQIMEEKQTIFAAGAGAVTKVYYPGQNKLERAFNVKNVQEYINRVDEMMERKYKLFRGIKYIL